MQRFEFCREPIILTFQRNIATFGILKNCELFMNKKDFKKKAIFQR